MNELYEKLLQEAYNAGLKSYSPYSQFRVGAALVTANGTIYTGTNIENRAYSPSVCAERVALFKAVSAGEHEIRVIAVVGLDCEYPLPPCGVCRQVISEFGKETIVIMADKTLKNYKTATIAELLPFDALDDLKKSGEGHP